MVRSTIIMIMMIMKATMMMMVSFCFVHMTWLALLNVTVAITVIIYTIREVNGIDGHKTPVFRCWKTDDVVHQSHSVDTQVHIAADARPNQVHCSLKLSDYCVHADIFSIVVGPTAHFTTIMFLCLPPVSG